MFLRALIIFSFKDFSKYFFGEKFTRRKNQILIKVKKAYTSWRENNKKIRTHAHVCSSKNFRYKRTNWNERHENVADDDGDDDDDDGDGDGDDILMGIHLIMSSIILRSRYRNNRESRVLIHSRACVSACVSRWSMCDDSAHDHGSPPYPCRSRTFFYGRASRSRIP